MGRGFWDYVLLPFNLSFRAEMNSLRFDGVLGPVFILTLPFVFLIKRISIAVRIGLVCSGLLFVFWAVSAQQMRYLIPIFPFLAITTGYILGHFHRKKAFFSILTLAVCLTLLMNGLHIFRQFKIIKPLNYITGAEDRHGFLSRTIPSYDMFHYLNTSLKKDAKIFFIYMKNLGFLCNRAYFSDSLFESHTIQKILKHSVSPQQVYTGLKRKGFTHILYDIQYVFGESSPLPYQGKTLFHAFQKGFLDFVKCDKGRYFLYRLKI